MTDTERVVDILEEIAQKWIDEAKRVRRTVGPFATVAQTLDGDAGLLRWAADRLKNAASPSPTPTTVEDFQRKHPNWTRVCAMCRGSLPTLTDAMVADVNVYAYHVATHCDDPEAGCRFCHRPPAGHMSPPGQETVSTNENRPPAENPQQEMGMTNRAAQDQDNTTAGQNTGAQADETSGSQAESSSSTSGASNGEGDEEGSSGDDDDEEE
jgi:hypothetical protein